jgi:hypothetical protein
VVWGLVTVVESAAPVVLAARTALRRPTAATSIDSWACPPMKGSTVLVRSASVPEIWVWVEPRVLVVVERVSAWVAWVGLVWESAAWVVLAWV